MTISAMAFIGQISDVFPSQISDPKNYYEGTDLPNRIICSNVIVFERLTWKSLQQQHVANRMHHRYVLMRVLKSSGIVSVDGQNYQLDVGDALLVTPYQFHHYIEIESDPLRWLFITFELEQGQPALADLSYRRLQPDLQTHQLWGEVANLWSSEQGASRVELIPTLDRLLARLHVTTLRLPQQELEGATTGHGWIAQVESLIKRSVREGWTFEEVAQRAGFSERHLRERFERQMGLSLRAYRSQYQFQTAISLMRDAKCSLADVAELSGFNSQPVFTRFIRRMAGRTPRELCRQVREGRYEQSTELS